MCWLVLYQVVMTHFCLQYERSGVMPTAEVESAYFEPLMQWRSSINSTADSPFFGMFAEDLALAGD